MFWDPGPHMRSPLCRGRGDSCPEELGSAFSVGNSHWAAGRAARWQSGLVLCGWGHFSRQIPWHTLIPHSELRRQDCKYLEAVVILYLKNMESCGRSSKRNLLTNNTDCRITTERRLLCPSCVCPPARGPWGCRSWPAAAGPTREPAPVLSVHRSGKRASSKYLALWTLRPC